MNASTTSTFTTTMAEVTLADSLTPTTSSAVTAATISDRRQVHDAALGRRVA